MAWSTKVVGIMVLLWAWPLHAEPVTIVPEKRQLIHQLLDIAQSKNLTSRTVDVMLTQMEHNYAQMIQEMEPQLTSSPQGLSKEQFSKLAVEEQQHTLQRFRELYTQQIDLPAIMEQVAEPLYDQYFTTEELQNLVTFYRSPTGQKTIQVMPDLMRSSMQHTSELLQPKVMALMKQILAEETERLRRPTTSATTQHTPTHDTGPSAPASQPATP